MNADIRAVRGAAPNCIGEDDVTKHLSSRRPAPAYSNVDRAAVTSIRLRSRIVALIANRRPLRGYHRSRREIKKSDCRAVDGAESFTRKRGSKSPLATSVGENGKKIWRSVAVVCSESGCRGLFNISSRASPRPRPFAPHTERAPESRTFALKAKRAKPRAGAQRGNHCRVIVLHDVDDATLQKEHLLADLATDHDVVVSHEGLGPQHLAHAEDKAVGPGIQEGHAGDELGGIKRIRKRRF